jgi:hypothetical protein
MTTTVEMSPATLAALERRGGNLFISLDGAGTVGMFRVRTTEPRAIAAFDTLECDAVRLHVDAHIEPPKRWVVIYKRLPWPHFDALYDPPNSGSGSLFEAILDNIKWR